MVNKLQYLSPTPLLLLPAGLLVGGTDCRLIIIPSCLLLTSSSFLQVTKKYGKTISLHNRGTSHGATKESSLKGTGRLIVQGAVLSTTAALKTAAPGAFPNASDEKKGVFAFSWYRILVERSFHGVLDPSLSEVGSSKEKPDVKGTCRT